MPHKEHWVQKQEKAGNISKGGLHRTLGKAQDEPITEKDLARARAMGGKAAKQAALAETFKGMNHRR